MSATRAASILIVTALLSAPAFAQSQGGGGGGAGGGPGGGDPGSSQMSAAPLASPNDRTPNRRAYEPTGPVWNPGDPCTGKLVRVSGRIMCRM